METALTALRKWTLARMRATASGAEGKDDVEWIRVNFVEFAAADPQTILQVALTIVSRLHPKAVVELTWEMDGKGPTNDALEAIHGYGFRDCIREEALKRGSRVEEVGSDRFTRIRISADHQYLPLTRYSRDSFIFTEPILRANPQIAPGPLQSLAAESLLSGGYLTERQIAAFRVSIFLEIAWNAVLHADKVIGAGACYFAGRASRRNLAGGQFEWALGDCGRGVAEALRVDPTLELALSAVPATSDSIFAIVGRLGHRNASSRTDHPPTGLDDGNRGYRHIADMARRTGSLRVRTSGLLVSLEEDSNADGTPRWRRRRFDHEGADAGTTVWGTFQPLTVEDYYRETGALDDEWPDRAGYVCLVAPMQTDELDIGDSLDARLQCAARPGRRLVLDFGFVDVTAENVIHVVVKAIKGHISCPLVVVGLAQVDEVIIDAISERLQRRQLLPPIPIYFHVDGREFIRLSFRGGSAAVARVVEWDSPPDAPIARASLHSPALTLISKVNDEYLREGIRRAGADGSGGFYRTDVRLFSGAIVGGFFAVGQNAKASASARRRWAMGVELAVAELVRHTQTREAVTIVAFSAPIETIAADAVRGIASLGLKGGIIARTYEPPTHDHLATLIPPGAPVVLLTDAIVSGTQLNSFVRVARRCGAHVIGAVSVLGLYGADRHFGFPVVSLGRTELPERSEGENAITPLAIDPVTLVPRRQSLEKRRAIGRAFDALRLLRESDAAEMAHFDLTGRHATFYVVVPRLLSGSQARAVRAMVEGQLARLDEPEFIGFSPVAVVHPLGVSGIARIGVPPEQNDHDLAHRMLREILLECKADWRIALRAPPIFGSRVIENGGEGRSSLPDELAARIVGQDVLVIDDGVSTGHTLRILLEQLRSWQARRVVVLALVARMSLDDVLWFESIRELRGPQGNSAMQLRFLLPLLVPVTLFKPGECPVELAILGIQSYLTAGRDISTVAQSIIDELRPRSLEKLRSSEEQREIAARAAFFRGAVELAASDAEAEGRLRAVLEAGDPLDDVALVAVLASEPRLLLRPGLRRWLSIKAQDAAIAMIGNASLDRERRIQGLTLMRTAFPERFADAIAALRTSGSVDGTLLERCAFQALTLVTGGTTSSDLLIAAELLRMRLRDEVKRGWPSDPNEAERLRRSHHLLQQLDWSPTLNSVSTSPESLTDALVLLLDALCDEDEFHDLPGFLLTIELLPTHATKISAEDLRWYARQWEPWPLRVVTSILPRLKALAAYLHSFLGIARDVDRRIVAAPRVDSARSDEGGLRYLTRTYDITGDLDAIGFSLSSADEARATTPVPLAMKFAATSAAQLHRVIFGKDSLLRKLARSLSQLVLAEAINLLGQVTVRIVPGARLVIDTEGIVRHEDDAKVLLISEELWLSAVTAVATNIATYASRGNAERTVYIDVRVRRDGDGVTFEFGEREEAAVEAREMSVHTRRLNERLETLDAWLDTTYLKGSPMLIDGVRTRIRQAIHVKFTPPHLLDLCTRL